MRSLLERAFGDHLAGRLVLQVGLTSIGTGFFVAAGTVFTIKHLHLSVAQAGAGLSVSGVVALVTGIPLGTVADRMSPRRLWLWSILVKAALFALYPFVTGFAGFLALMAAFGAAESAAAAGRSTYTLEVLPQEIRLKAQAHMRVALNAGIAAGSLGASAVLLLDSPQAYVGLALGNALTLLLDAWFIARLPDSERAGGGPRPKERQALIGDRPVLALSLLSGFLATNRTVLALLLPAWAMEITGVRPSVVAALFTLNTAMVILLQVSFARGADDVPGAVARLRRAALALCACSLVFAGTRYAADGTAVALLAAGTVALTCAELWHVAGFWGLSNGLSPAGARGAYLALFRLGDNVEKVAAPVALVGLVFALHVWGWLLLAAAYAIAAACVRPVTAWAERTARTVPAARRPLLHET
ncbi:MFS transporter [Streptosporangium sp. NPDC003464]